MNPAALRATSVMALVQSLLDLSGQTEFRPEVQPLASETVEAMRAGEYERAAVAAAKILDVESDRLSRSS